MVWGGLLLLSTLFFPCCWYFKERRYLCIGEMAEWSNATVLKTVVRQRTGGSNPSFSANKGVTQ